ncbi:hypothetical protein CHH79_15590 [Bacillus siamensis]|uniref:PLAT/LH2 domain-containing protein n=1 Tax=Bacillus TaxID=1386 RepID=UPI00037209E9|nr:MULTISPECIES: PLAT/LH2 domain-containing protein [Bacillus]MBD0408879.1 hypothetical protein [Bacillus sp. 1021]MED0773890.1 PLAT/LH2 domain-containing protein [Bacillus siamensis]MED0775813.1 PLAT/LH2 domain-containing protein [Bacillus siamensis]MED0781782.1 PLAT/LH2 domain-containing protein [Bacillus siamensis]MED0832605.1 PLAT/LH2 domain-containing protein [Bacillus siamensis]
MGLYYVDFRTSTVKDSGTDAPITLIIHDEQHKPHWFKLFDPKGNYFESGSFTSFEIETINDLGSIPLIKIWHDQTGTNPYWNLEFVSIRTDSSFWLFPHYDWLEKSTTITPISCGIKTSGDIKEFPIT